MNKATDDDLQRALVYLPSHPHLAGVIAQAMANERARCANAAIEARDMLLAGCESNGGWLGIEMMKAHDILKEAFGDGQQERLI